MSSKCECYAIIDSDDPRAGIWRAVTGELKLPIMRPLLVTSSGGPFEGQPFYHGDLRRLTQKQIETLADEMSKKFYLSRESVLYDLRRMDHGLPIKATGVNIIICKLHVRTLG